MPTETSYDVTSELPRPVGSRFELAARRLMESWLATGRLRVARDDFQLATDFLVRSGLKVQGLTGGDARIVSEQGRSSVVTREGAVVLALRRMAALDAEHALASVVARAA